MKKQKYIVNILIFVIVIGIIFLTIYFNNDSTNSTTSKTIDLPTNDRQDQNISASIYKTKTNAEGAVTVEVSPQQLSTNINEVIFKVILSTHSVNLNQPFTKIMILKDNLGNTYNALEWTGGSGGHHLTGNITFPKINLDAKKVTLFINEIDGVNREFVWDIDI